MARDGDGITRRRHLQLSTTAGPTAVRSAKKKEKTERAALALGRWTPRSCIGAHFRRPACFFPVCGRTNEPAPRRTLKYHWHCTGPGAIMSCRIRASLRFAGSDAPCTATTRSRRSASTTPHKQTHRTYPRAHVLPVLPRYLSLLQPLGLVKFSRNRHLYRV